MNLRPYQDNFVSNLSRSVAKNKQVIGQAATGSGKTVIFSTIANRFKGGVLILVHRIELLQQTRRTLYDMYGISAQIIVSGMRTIPDNRVYIGMVESANKRISQLKNIGLVIIDEAHRAEFNKIHRHFESAYTIGFTATPLAANKKEPLKKYYNDIVCCIDIPELIKLGSLCQNITYAPKDIVDRESLKVKGNDFETGLMSASFSKPRYVVSVINSYKKIADNTKAIVFNCGIEHSKLVADAFIAAGYNAKHLDGASEARDHIIKWFKTTPNAILCNCDIATTGFDVPDIETVIVNISTMSMPLWMQMCGRGSRPTPAKSAFTIIDMGGNAVNMGDWDTPRNWEDIFWNPPKASKGDGVAPVKLCPECDAIIPAQSQTCKYCGFAYPPKEMELEELLNDFVVVTKGIDVNNIMERHKEKKEYFPFFNIGTTLAYQAKQTVPKMTDENAEFILSKYHELAKEWAHKRNKKYNQWHKDRAKEHLFTELQRHFKKWNYVSSQSNALTIPRHG